MLGKGDYLILLAAFLSFLFSVSLWFGFGVELNKEAGAFVGLWVPSILATGIFFHVAVRRRLVSDTPIFNVGLGTFILLLTGILFTQQELKKLSKRLPTQD